MQSAKHQKAKQQEGNKAKQQFLPTFSKDFTGDVVRACLSADIPLKKLRNPELRKLFIQIGKPLPSETSCRDKTTQLANEETARVKEILTNKDVFLMVDETDIKGNKFLAILGGLIDNPHRTFMIDCIPLSQSPNTQIIVLAIDDVLKGLGTERQQFALLISDAAAYMVSAGRQLKLLYPDMFHVTCVSHLLHNAALKVKANYEAVDNLISCVKASIVKNKTRKGLFDAIGVPPEPVVTRWSSWLKAAFYYADHFPRVCQIVGQFDGHGLIVRKAKEAVAQPGLAVSLMDLKRCYSSLADLVIQLESDKATIESAYRKVKALDFGSDPCQVKPYLEKRLEKNDITEIVNLSRNNISPTMYGKLQQCLVTSAAVERSFSMLSKMMAKDRNFKLDNVRKYIVLRYNSAHYEADD